MDEKMTLADAVRLGIKKGWSSKETAFQTGHKLLQLQKKALKMKTAFAWQRIGPIPKFISVPVSPDSLVERERRTLAETSRMLKKLARMLPDGSKQEAMVLKTLGYISKRRVPPTWQNRISMPARK